ncbi:DMT family transporter [Zobellia amurskyensis]|uniref:DMT family transporter n=1 Tax=Zobellia amurskyensis TaxID=248905 RepID=A0A7X3D2D0_9FLAO|nr:DMT family transporter [Zobellia amurskyensis]MUH36351.1 DMT family transporter [Zobellia amurskyensis]
MNIKKVLFYMIISALAFTLMNVSVKQLQHYSVYQIVFFRGFGSFILTMAILKRLKIPILGNNRKLLVLRAIVGTSSMTLFFMSLKYLSAGTAVSLRYLAPIFSAVFAIFILKEKIKPVQWLFFIISFIGVLTLKGLDSNLDNTGLLLVFGAAVLSGLVYIIISKIGKSDHPIVIVNYFMFTATIFGGVLAIPYWQNPIGVDWMFFLTLGIFGFIGQLYMTKAFQIASNNLVAPFKYLEVLFTGLIGFMWLGEVYTIWSLVGIILIILGLVMNVLYKARDKRYTL